VAIFAGCATTSQHVILEPDTPIAVAVKSKEAGYLKVYSYGVQLGDYDIAVPTPSDYSIFSGDEKLPQRVDNSAGRASGGPVLVPLPQGSYSIQAETECSGPVTVPIVITAQKMTVVHLDQGCRVKVPKSDVSQRIRLPDRRLVGWIEVTEAPAGVR
jgi:hypothetical protein